MADTDTGQAAGQAAAAPTSEASSEQKSVAHFQGQADKTQAAFLT